MKDKQKVKRKVTVWQVGRGLTHFVRAVIIIGICFIILQPLFTKVSVSFMAERDLYDSSVKYIAKHFTLDNYKIAIEGMDYWTVFIRSLLLSGVSPCCSCLPAC